MSRAPALYRAGVRAALLALPLAGRLNAKIRRATAARRGLRQRLARWGATTRDHSRPLIWMHATSVGEGLHAKPVLSALHARHADWQLFYTHFSPSAERFAAGLDVDGHDYLPFDTPSAQAAALDALRPSVLVFAHVDVWPTLTLAARGRGIPVALVSAVVSPASSRLGPIARRLVGSAYRALDAVAAADRDQIERLARLGVRRDAIEVLGDTRFDSASARAGRAHESGWTTRLAPGGSLVVAGSTWPPDEAVLLDAFARVRRERPDARLVIAPHEPTPEHLADVRRAAVALGLPDPVRLAQLDEAAAPPGLILVDRVGVLADLYGAGAFAYVGGGFGRSGLHSVLEPAAARVPIIVGPHGASRDAGLLQAAGALVTLPGGAAAVTALAAQWLSWLTDPVARRTAGDRAYAVVEAGRGAADRTARLIERLVSTTAVRAGG